MTDRHRRVLLHIGTHKTGTTSLQQFLRDAGDDLLAAQHAFVPPGFLVPTLHAELPLLTIRPTRMWPARLRFPETQQAEWLTEAAEHVQAQVESAHELLVYSHEDLSYVRFDDELARLRELLGERAVTVVVYLREKSAFLSSYRAQLDATGFPSSDDPSSYAYTQPDSWLVDYDVLVAGFRRRFGDDHVVAFDYDEVMRRDGSIIPSFTDLLDIPRSSLPPLDQYFFNRSGAQLRPTADQIGEIRQRLAERRR